MADASGGDPACSGGRAVRAVHAIRLRPTAAPRLVSSVLRLALRHRFPRLVQVRAPFRGTTVVADLTTPTGLCLYRYGWADPDLDLMASLVHADQVVVDCGANVGLFAICAARAGAEWVYAIEPTPHTRRALERNLSAARTTAVTVLPFALADANGEASFTVMPADGLSSFAPAAPAAGPVTTVTVARLDDVIPVCHRRAVGVIKLDVEGAEENALRGAIDLIYTSRPAILIEVEDDHLRRQGSSAPRLRALLREWGYQLKPGARPPNELYLPEPVPKKGADESGNAAIAEGVSPPRLSSG